MYTIYLKETDMLEENHFPAIALVNEACNSNIINFFQNLIRGIGSGYNYSSCCFWNELDEYDQSITPPFDGLSISTAADEEIILSYKDFLYYMELAAKCIANTNLELSQQICAQLEEYKTIFAKFL